MFKKTALFSRDGFPNADDDDDCDDNNDEHKDRDDNDDKTLVHLGCRRDECRALYLDANSCSPLKH